MPDRDVNDPPGANEAFPNDDAEKHQLAELAKMLDAPVEKVRGWLQAEGIHPVHPDYPEDYGLDALEYVRLKRHQF